MMYYVIAWVGLIILAAYCYKYMQEVKEKAYKEGFDDGWEARHSIVTSVKMDVEDYINLVEMAKEAGS